MLTNLVSIITKSLSSTGTSNISASSTIQKVETKPSGYKPFGPNQSLNPFMNSSFRANEGYAKNAPVSGGYFAGYYNGKPNIVGRKLFIEV